jgi:hypothetical protein
MAGSRAPVRGAQGVTPRGGVAKRIDLESGQSRRDAGRRALGARAAVPMETAAHG